MSAVLVILRLVGTFASTAMILTLPPRHFQLTDVVRTFLEEQEWYHELSVDGFMSQVSTWIVIHEQLFKLYIDVDERTQLVSVFIYSPIRIPVGRLREALAFLNKANGDAAIGRFAIDDDGDANPVQWMCSYDLEGGALTTRQIELMIAYGTHAFCRCWRGIAAVALIGRSADEAYDDACKRDAASAMPDNVLRLHPMDRIL